MSWRASAERGLIEHWNGSGWLLRHHPVSNMSILRFELEVKYLLTPSVYFISSSVSLPVSSFSFSRVNVAKTDTIVAQIVVSAICRPGQILNSHSLWRSICNNLKNDLTVVRIRMPGHCCRCRVARWHRRTSRAWIHPDLSKPCHLESLPWRKFMSRWGESYRCSSQSYHMLDIIVVPAKRSENRNEAWTFGDTFRNEELIIYIIVWCRMRHAQW